LFPKYLEKRDSTLNRNEIASLMITRLEKERSFLQQSYQNTKKKIGYFLVNDLLPESLVNEIYLAFPDSSTMRMRKNLREFKYVTAQMDECNPILEEVLYAFQDSCVVDLMKNICEIDSLYPDDNLYAGGISLMGENHYLNPHLDNSHDRDKKKWRVLNLLFYVSPNWQLEYGGNLEIWPNGIKNKQTTLLSKFNRLVVMATHDSSWHSVSPVTYNASRCCVSNYYFSDFPLKKDLKFHVTSFRGRPEQKFRDAILQTDNALRMGVRKVFSAGIAKTEHVYKK